MRRSVVVLVMLFMIAALSAVSMAHHQSDHVPGVCDKNPDHHLCPSDSESPSEEESPSESPSPSEEESPSESPSPSESTSEEETVSCDQTYTGDVLLSGFTVPDGEVWCFDPDSDTTVTSTENVVVEGTLVMKPSSADVVHTLKFVGIDETQMVGGHTETPIEADVGLWVVDAGQLDLQGTPRVGWNRTGDDPSWRSGDEVRQAPQEPGDTTTFATFTPGDPVPSVTAPDGTVHHTEVFNLTRNVRIHGGGQNPPDQILENDGRAHVICLMCSQPQTIKYVEFRWVGPRTTHSRDGTDGLLGRYGLHFHLNGDGSQGSVVEGTVVRDAGNHAYVPHESHGITFYDTISFDTFESAYRWDENTETHDVLYDHAAALLTQDYPDYRGYGLKGFNLAEGVNMTIRDSVVVGNQGRKVNAGGFMWPSSANSDLGGHNIWTFTNNVAHNNKDAGLGVWQNDSNDHLIENYVGYFNKRGISHGAYNNNYRYLDIVLFDNRFAVTHHALARSGGQSWTNVDTGGDDIWLVKHSLASSTTVEYVDLRLREGKVVVDESREGGVFLFRSTVSERDLSLSDFEVLNCLSDITVEHADGTTFKVC